MHVELMNDDMNDTLSVGHASCSMWWCIPLILTCTVDTDTQIKLYALRLLQSLILEPENPSVAHRALEVVSNFSDLSASTHSVREEPRSCLTLK